MRTRHPAQTALRWIGLGVGLASAAYVARAIATWRGYGRPAPGAADEADALLDQFMPRYDVVERRHARLTTPPDITLAAATSVDIQRSVIAGALFRGRALLMGAHEEEEPPAAPHALITWAQSIGWTLLANDPGHEVVMGSVTQPWKPAPTFQTVAPEAFAAFNEPDYVKIAWTLRAEPFGEHQSTLYHETRAVATDAESRRLFRRYWTIFSPGIALIRWALLGPVSPFRREARRRMREVTAPQPAYQQSHDRDRFTRLGPAGSRR